MMESITAYFSFIILTASLQQSKCDRIDSLTHVSNLTDDVHEEPVEPVQEIKEQSILNCDARVFDPGEFFFLKNGSLYVPIYERTFSSAAYDIFGKKLALCRQVDDDELFKNARSNRIEPTWHADCVNLTYEPGEYQILSNGSVSIGDEVLSEHDIRFSGNILLRCALQSEYRDWNISSHATFENGEDLSHLALIYAGNIGAGLSILALVIYLVIFCCVPSRRNLPGSNLTSMSVSLLLGYTFSLVALIPEVLGASCIASAVLRQFFFLASFFWMNVMAYDVWRALRNATTNFMVATGGVKVRKFLLYSLYAWGVPLAISLTALIADIIPDVPYSLRPLFGNGDVCWFTQDYARILFFVAPALAVLVVNAVFFGLSAYMIIHNTIKGENRQQAAAKRSFALYARMGIIMGVTWLFAIIAVVAEREELWFIFDLLNSSQGVFVLLLFSCSRKMRNRINQRVSERTSKIFLKATSSDKIPCAPK